MDDIIKNYAAVEAVIAAPSKRQIHRATDWAVEHEEVLRQKWNEGLSSRAIAELIGKTKNAVIGKARRMNLPQHQLSNKKGPRDPSEKSPTVKFSNPRKKVHAPRKIASPAPLHDIVPIGIMSLKPNSCRAIVGKGKDGLAVYCGDDCFWNPELGRFKPYCEAHSAIYYNHDIKRRRH